jgi:hypothetical protein
VPGVDTAHRRRAVCGGDLERPQGDPTDLVGAGAFAGLVAGSISAMAYALHCTDDSLPFVTVWYSGTIALCTLAGALWGPRLLRW